MSCYDLPTGYGAFDQESIPEEPTCPKCLELESECQCDEYDQIEEDELAKELAEAKFNNLKPIRIRVRKMKKVII